MLEVWQIIDQAVHGNRFAHAGVHYRLPDVPQAIRLYRPRRLDTFFVAWTPAIIEHAVACDAVPFVTVGWGDSKALQAMRETVAGKYREAGRELAGRRFAAQRYVFVSDSKAEIRKAAEGARYAGRCAGHMRVGAQILDGHRIRDVAVAGEPSLEQIEAALPIGDARTVAERLVREIREVGITDLSCFMWPAGMEPRSVLRSMERFGAEVMPQVRQALAAQQPAPAREVA
jgi:alkanesulfonate monooxygenase SsuD/methylene tetrahydromethanopterin reductase-like flavin-dependent oxidoreductase (luciferase family)